MRHPNYTEISFSVFDAETNIRNVGPDAIGKSEPSPHHPDNGIEWYGVTTPSTYVHCHANTYYPGDWGDADFHMGKSAHHFLQCIEAGVKVLVGHNIKFDLLHMMCYPMIYDVLMNWLRDGGVIWDTMLAEYLLTGQHSQFISLDRLSAQNGGTVKDSRLKDDYWKKGIDTSMIPKEIILPYLKEDLRNTAINYMAQLDKIESLVGQHKWNFYALIASQMEGLLATTMIEHNGIHFDIPSAADAAASLAVLHDAKEDWLKDKMAQWFEINNEKGMPKVRPEDVNPSSQWQIGCMIVGGSFKYQRVMPVRDEHGNKVKYKGGKQKGNVKYRNEDLIVHVDGMMKHRNHGLSQTPSGQYQTDETSLKKLLKHSYVQSKGIVKEFIEGLMSYRSMAKELSTSYMGLLKLTWPTDSCIHGNMNHTSTNTGRLSSSAPNQQNFSGKEAKE